MAIQSDETLVTKGDLKILYTDKILPYLGGNMMMQTGVSDYYSTDEKIVGVWTDGKPLYQKVIVDTLPSAINTPKYVNIGASIDYIFILNSMLDNQDGFYIPIPSLEPVSDSKQTRVAAANNLFITAPNTLQFRTANSAHVGKTICVIVCYTKTTDAANSAITTPGCYDITRPDLWPENKEIFFGNGLYGYRAVGTANVTADTLTAIKLNVMLRNIISSGGYGTYNSTGDYMALNYNQSDGRYALSLYGHVADGLYISYKVAITHNAHYDIWVTYTK